MLYAVGFSLGRSIRARIVLCLAFVFDSMRHFRADYYYVVLMSFRFDTLRILWYRATHGLKTAAAAAIEAAESVKENK